MPKASLLPVVALVLFAAGVILTAFGVPLSDMPGQLGPAIILGHVDSARYGPGVSFKLGPLHPDATVSITRADHTVAVVRSNEWSLTLRTTFPPSTSTATPTTRPCDDD